MCCKKKNTNGQNSDDDSYEEDDDICIEDAKPKNPFAFKRQVEEATKNNDKYKNERFKYYGSTAQMPAHARTKIKATNNLTPTVIGGDEPLQSKGNI